MTQTPQRTRRNEQKKINKRSTPSGAIGPRWVGFIPRGNLAEAHVRKGSDLVDRAERAGDPNVKLLLVTSIGDVERVVDGRFLPSRGRRLLDALKQDLCSCVIQP